MRWGGLVGRHESSASPPHLIFHEGKKMDDLIKVRIGGSNRQYDRTVRAFTDAGIELRIGGYAGHGHHSNQVAFITDTKAARDLLRKMKGTVAREQKYYLKRSQPRMDL